MSEETKCFVCGRVAGVAQNLATGFAWQVDCHWCGPYLMRFTLQEDIANDRDASALLPYLAAHIRQSPRRGKWLEVGSDWEDAARGHASTPIAQRVRMLLELIAQQSDIGKAWNCPTDEIAPWIDAHDEAEAQFLLKHLAAKEYISVDFVSTPVEKRRPSGSGILARIVMTISGWEAVSPVAGTGIAGTCFVAMSFDSALDEAFEKGMVAAIHHDCGFEVVRIDRVHHNDDITDRILAGIRSAQFIVADFTKQRPGVYFEAGFAAGLGRTVIWTCHAADFDKLHFDTRQRNHIKWSTHEELRQQLTERIRATVTLPARLSSATKGA